MTDGEYGVEWTLQNGPQSVFLPRETELHYYYNNNATEFNIMENT